MMIKVGTSGFQFPDWKGTVYPERVRQQDMLTFYEESLGFDVLEVNYTYYRLPFAKTMEAMARKTSEHFEFVVRSHREMTHEIWEDKERSRLKANRDIFKRFLDGLEPLIRRKKLGCVLLQFPYYFLPTNENLDYILASRSYLKGVEIVVEFRHQSWVQEKVFDFLTKNGLGFCIVDEPRLSGLMPTQFVVTSSIAYLRFHGRNPQWFGASKEDRYRYDYSEQELTELIPEIRRIEPFGKHFYAFFNNCSQGFAVKNALMFKKLID